MNNNYTLQKKMDKCVQLALAYSKSLQVIQTKTIKQKTILINN